MRSILQLGSVSNDVRTNYVLRRNDTHNLSIKAIIYQPTREPHATNIPNLFTVPEQSAPDSLFSLRLSAGRLIRSLRAKASILSIDDVLLPLVPDGHFVFQVTRLPVPGQEAVSSQDFDVDKHGSTLEAALKILRDISMAAAGVGRVCSS